MILSITQIAVAVIGIIVAVAQLAVIRYLGIDPGFRIKTRAAGQLTMWFAFGSRWVIYGDVDRLGLINDALTDPATGIVGHDRFNEIARWVFARIRRADAAQVYGGDEWRILISGTSDWHAFCTRFQSLLRSAPYTDEEQARLMRATGNPYVTITLGAVRSGGVFRHQRALDQAKACVQCAKPKAAAGLRGHILNVDGGVA
jgi:GGDEF domain-containing protein